MLYKKITIIFYLLTSAALYASEPQCVVVIPSYNNEQWCERNITSVLDQAYEHFRVIYIDDCSTDSTYASVCELIAQHPQGFRVNLKRNEQRCGALENLYNAIHTCDDHEIVVTVDGDDWLDNPGVLNRIAQEYLSGDVWMTHGDFAWWPNGARSGLHEIHPTYIAINAIRSFAWVTSHLRTFYAGLFKKIKKEDLLYEGKFFPVTWDLAMMFPMLEMSGFHTRFINEVLYQYNYATPFNDAKTSKQLQEQLEYHIRDKQSYQPLDKLFD